MYFSQLKKGISRCRNLLHVSRDGSQLLVALANYGQHVLCLLFSYAVQIITYLVHLNDSMRFLTIERRGREGYRLEMIFDINSLVYIYKWANQYHCKERQRLLRATEILSFSFAEIFP